MVSNLLKDKIQLLKQLMVRPFDIVIFTDTASFISNISHLNIIIYICLGVRSIEHPNVLSEKNNFSAPGGPKSAKFDPGHLDPIYFEIGNFSALPDPPICLKMPKCAKFCTFGESRLKHTPKVGVYREKF